MAANRKVTLTVKRENVYRTTDGIPWPSRKEAERQQARLDLIELLKESLADPHAHENAREVADDLISAGDRLMVLLRAIHKGDEPFTPPASVARDDEQAA